MGADEIFEAIKTGNADRVTDLVAQDSSLAVARNEQGISVVMWALYNQRRDLAEVVSAAKPSLDVMEATAMGRIAELGELVAEDPARVGEHSLDGFTPLHLAAFFGQPAAVKWLLERSADPNAVAKNPTMVRPLHSAVASGVTESVVALVDGGADVNAAQQGGWTPLQAAAMHNRLEMVRSLLAAGADVAQQADDGKTAIGRAEAGGHDEMVKVLEAGVI